jgi:O-antigen/teichoic acid export membrane protein
MGQGWSALMALAFVPVYIRFLGIEAYGLIGLFAVLQAWLTLLDMGMTPTLAREMARFTGGSHSAGSIRDLLRSIETLAVVAALLVASGIALGSTWLASSWLQAESMPLAVVAQAFTIMGAVTAVRLVEGVYRSSLVGLQRQVLLNVVNSSMSTLRGLGAVAVLAWVAPTIQAFFLWQGLVSLGTVVVLAVATYTSLPNTGRGARFSIAALRNVRRFAGGMMGIVFLSLLLTKIDKLLLSRLLSLSEYGYYMLAAAVAGALYMLVSPITQAWYPRLSQLHAAADHAGMAQAYHQGAQLVTVVVGSAAIVLILFSETLLQLWTQDAELAGSAALLVSLLVLGNLLNILMLIPYQTQLAHGWTGLTIRINIVAVLIVVPAIFWVAPRYGAEGAAWVWVSLNAGYLLIGVHFMYRRVLTQEKWRWYWQDVLQPLGAAAAVAYSISWMAPQASSIAGQVASLAAASTLTITAAALAASRVRERVYFMLRSGVLAATSTW